MKKKLQQLSINGPLGNTNNKDSKNLQKYTHNELNTKCIPTLDYFLLYMLNSQNGSDEIFLFVFCLFVCLFRWSYSRVLEIINSKISRFKISSNLTNEGFPDSGDPYSLGSFLMIVFQIQSLMICCHKNLCCYLENFIKDK